MDEKFAKSINSLREFWSLSGKERGLFKVDIETYKKRPKEMFFYCSDVLIGINIESMDAYLYINWEDADYEDYARLGLLGRYSASNSKMIFKNETKPYLEVNSPKGSKILKIYLSEN